MTLHFKYHGSQFKGENTNIEEVKPSNRNIPWRHGLAEIAALNGAV